MTVRGGSDVRVAFQEPVSEVVYRGPRGLRRRTLPAGAHSVSLGAQPPTGTVQVAAAPRSWETVGTPTPVSWFPPSHYPVMATYPSPSSRITPAGTIYLTFSKPVSEVLGGHHPTLSPYTPGRWSEADSHTLVFRPSGFGAPLGSELKMTLPHRVSVTSGSGSGLEDTSQVQWTVPVWIDAAPAAAAGRAGIPAAGVAAVGPPGRTDGASAGAGGRGTAAGELPLALSQHAPSADGRCGPPVRRTRSCVAP